MNILINRTDALGDTLLTLPMVKLIKEKKPEYKVGMLVGPKCAELMPLIEEIDRYWVFNKDALTLRGKWKFLTLVFREFRPDAYLFVGGSHWPSFYAWLKRVKARLGLLSKLPSFLFLNKGTRQSRSFEGRHESDYNMTLLAPLGIEHRWEERDKYQVRIKLDRAEKERVWQQFRREKGEREMILFHVGMGGHTLNWPVGHYGELILQLASLYPGRYFYTLSYTPVDRPYIEGLRQYLTRRAAELMEGNIYFYNGAERGLRHFAHLLSHAKLFVGPSTGITHLANCLGAKQVLFYSPIKAQRAVRWGPFRENASVRVLTPEVKCEELLKCAGEVCSFYQCMEGMEVKRALQVCQQLLEEEY